MNTPREDTCGRSAVYALGALLSAALVTGCTTHYREALETYRQAEPTPFYQRTMEWTESDPATTDAPEALSPSEPMESMDGALQETGAADKPAQVAARVLGMTSEYYLEQTTQLASDSTRDAALANGLDWRELMLTVAMRNPRVEAAKREWEATLNQYSQAEFLEGLLREYKSFTRFLDVDAGEALQKGMTREFFPYPSIMAYKGEMIREQVRLAELAWERALRETLVEAGTAYFDYQFQYQGAETVEENVTLLQNLVDVVQDRYATGLASQPDVLRLQTELERQRKLLRDFEARQRATSAELNAMLGRPAGAPLGRPVPKELPYRAPTMDNLVDTSLQHRQEVLEQEARVARTEIAIRMGEIMNRPDYSQGYSTLDRGMMADASTGVPMEPFGARPDAASPRPAYAQAEAYLAETRQRLESAKARLEQLRLDTRALARTTLEQADIAQRQTALIEDVVLPLDQSAYDITLQSYTVGELTFLDLLDSERKLIATRLELDQSRRDRNQAVLRLANVRGFLDDVAP
jgi:hypothetical protein